jgi:hypothetical protein
MSWHPFTAIGSSEVFVNEGLVVIRSKEILKDDRMWLNLIMFRHDRVPDLEDVDLARAEFLDGRCSGDVTIMPGNKFSLEVWALLDC